VKKVKTFLHDLKASIVPQSPYYSKVLKSRFNSSFLYFFSLFILIAGVVICAAVIKTYQNNIDKVGSCMTKALETIPSNFTITIDRGNMSTNMGMPVFVWNACQNKTKLFLVIDERISNQDVSKPKAEVLISRSDLYIRYRSHLLSLPLQKLFPQLHLNKQELIKRVQTGITIYKFLLLSLVASFFLFIPLSIMLINIVCMFISSMSVYVFFVLFHKRYSFRKIVQIGLHSCSLPLFITAIFVFTPLHLYNILMLFFALFFIFQLVAVYEAHYANI